MIDVLDLTIIAKAADPAVAGVAQLPADMVAQPGWTVLTRADGTKLRVDGVSANSAAVTALMNADTSDAVVKGRWSDRYTATMVTTSEAIPARTVALFRLAFTMVNDGRQNRQLGRVQEPDLITMAKALLIDPAATPGTYALGKDLSSRCAAVPFSVAAGVATTYPVTWKKSGTTDDLPFADVNYRVNVTPEYAGTTAPAGPLLIEGVFNKTATGCQIRVRNITGLLGLLGVTLAGTLNVTAEHD